VLGEHLAALIAPSRSEPGCLAYAVHQGRDDPHQWFIHEVWRSPDDLAAHLEKPYVKTFLAQLPSLVEGEINMRAFYLIDHELS
jgi:quinol monooxygenase YgiN